MYIEDGKLYLYYIFTFILLEYNFILSEEFDRERCVVRENVGTRYEIKGDLASLSGPKVSGDLSRLYLIF